jgi:uncharacterized membrane protein YkoI
MRPRRSTRFLTFLTALLILAGSARAQKTVSLSSLPAPAQKTIQSMLSGATLDEIEQSDEDGQVSYTANITRHGKERDFTVAADGRLLSEEVTLDETPPPVQIAIKAHLRDGTLDNIEKTFEETQISYDVDITRKDGISRSFTVGLDGKLVSQQISLEEAPVPVKKTIQTRLAGGKLGDIYRTFEDGAVAYYVEFSRDGKQRDFSVGPNGKLESTRMFLSEIPTEAQATIQDKIGKGAILRIDKVFPHKQGSPPYEIEGRKDGRPFNFSVGPKGAFLGMDE